MSKESKPPKRAPAEVKFYSYPKLLFIWPIIAMGFIFWLMPTEMVERVHIKLALTVEEDAAQAEPKVIEGELVSRFGGFTTVKVSDEEQQSIADEKIDWGKSHESSLSEKLGWIYLLLTLTTIITIGVDIERNHAVFWLAIFVAFWGAGYWLSDTTGFTLFGNIFRWFASQDVRYSQGFGIAMAILLGIPYTVMIVWTRLQHRWRITHNEFQHYSFGRADDSLARGAKRVRTTYPDLLELLLCGSGTLIVYSATGRQELRRIRHVPLLPLLRRKIDSILETTAVTHTDSMIEEEIEAEEDDASSEEDAGGQDDGGGDNYDDDAGGGEGGGFGTDDDL